MKKTVIITGGTSGIGFATAEKFLLEGYTVITGSVDAEHVVKKAMEELQKLGEVYYRRLNVTEEAACTDIVAYVKEEFGRIDVLVNAAGIRGKVVPPTESDFSDIERTLQVNLMGTIQMATKAAVVMKEQGFGTIVNIGSISGEMVTAVDYGYHCSKAAVSMATKILAKEVSPYGVRCVAVSPAGVSAGMNSAEWERQGRKLHIKNRLLEAKEVADAVYLMTLQGASAINGSVLMLDDGYTAFKGIY